MNQATTLLRQKRGDRRTKARQPHVKFNEHQRMEFTFWYACLLPVLQRDMRIKKSYAFTFKVRNKECPLPKDAVRDELRHIFEEDWKCSLFFNDLNGTVHLREMR